MASVGTLFVYDPQEPVPSADGFTSTVAVDGPSATEEPRAYGDRGSARVVWSPERGWLCEEHTTGPSGPSCIHTEGLNPPGLPQEIA